MNALDEDHLSSLADGVGAEVLHTVIGLFLEHLAPRVEALAVAVAAADAPAIARAAHALKGAAVSIGAIELGDTCERAEAAARAGETATASAAATGVPDVAERTRRALEEYLARE